MSQTSKEQTFADPAGEESLTTYKLMILRILDQTDYPLTDSQLSEFFVSHEYVDYFQFRRAISELLDSEYLSRETVRNMTRYHVTPAGKEALGFFDYKIPYLWLKDILSWLEENSFELRREVEVSADYYPVKKGWRTEYMVKGCIREKGEILMDLTLNVVSKDQAVRICDHWQEKSNEVYGSLMNLLVLDDSL
jgi:hypothetical protein